MSAFTASNSLLPTGITGWLVLSAFDPNLGSGLESLRSRSIVLSITLSKKLSAYFAGRGPLPLLARTSGFAEDRPSWPLLIPRIPQTTSALTPPHPPPKKTSSPAQPAAGSDGPPYEALVSAVRIRSRRRSDLSTAHRSAFQKWEWRLANGLSPCLHRHASVPTHRDCWRCDLRPK